MIRIQHTYICDECGAEFPFVPYTYCRGNELQRPAIAPTPWSFNEGSIYCTKHKLTVTVKVEPA